MYSRSIFFVLSLYVLAPFGAYADSAVQTDWSDGGGIPGPVLEWGNEFYQSSFINWYTNPGFLNVIEGCILEHTVDGDFDGANSVYSADIDGDGDMDVLGAARVADDITWWENIDGLGTSWTEHTVDGDFDGSSTVYSEDIDGDGDMDVLGAARIADDITWWENINGSGTSWGKHTVEGDFDGARCVYSADINGDGFMDILGAAYSAGDITWWENIDGSGTSWAEHTVDGNFYATRCVYSEDIDGDGFMDVLGAGQIEFTWWKNIDGSGISWTEYTVDAIDGGAYSVYSADINNDGFMDVLGAGGNDIIWWKNIDGSGTSWYLQYVAESIAFARSVYSEDINDDGGMDILGAGRSSDEIIWWENIYGSGWDWDEYIVDEDFDGANSVYSEDINGDGYMDILGAAYYGDDITWWDITPMGWLESSILDTQGDTDWDYLEWNSQTPPGSCISFQVRASAFYTDMGAWSDDILTSPCPLEGILNDGDRYVQYRTILSSSHHYITPVLYDVTITWDPLGVGDDPQVTEYLLRGAKPNPACGVVHIGFTVPELSSIELYIFDLTGHLVATPVQGEYSHGVNEVQIDELTPGIYFCRMISGNFIDEKRFVVIE